MNIEDYEYKKSNREEAMTPKSKAHHYCGTCDMAWVRDEKKCPVCGTRGKRTRRRLKKETNA